MPNSARKARAELTVGSILGHWQMNEDSVEAFLHFSTRLVKNSNAQLLQDLWVLWESLGRAPGVFLDIGAGDGKYLSNTLLLEQSGWSGVLVEPNLRYYSELAKRRSPAIQKCVWDVDDQDMTLISVAGNLELSRLDVIAEKDQLELEGKRDQHSKDIVRSTTISSIISEYKMPKVIDYLSIDIEGAEYTVLKSLEFERQKFRLITVEHNFMSAREEIHKLLASNGYVRKWPQISAWDDWYVHSDFVTEHDYHMREAMDRLAQLWVMANNIPEADRVNFDISKHWPA